ncbi:MAG: hypothetical protein JOZ24_13420 [Candidatus Eremiobacteraeota bacterium]|nr:hypothetical protein [Candidatus Eremiobacteraeota bacterium]
MRSAFLSRALATRVITVAALLAAAACSGGSSSSGTSPVPTNGVYCDPGTTVQLARPFPGQTGVSTGTNSIEIVASGNNNTLYQSYTSFDIILQGHFSGRFSTNALNLAPSDPSAPHPYSSDYYYTGTLSQSLAAGDTYDAYLNIFNSSCTQLPYLGSFST